MRETFWVMSLFAWCLLAAGMSFAQPKFARPYMWVSGWAGGALFVMLIIMLTQS